MPELGFVTLLNIAPAARIAAIAMPSSTLIAIAPTQRAAHAKKLSTEFSFPSAKFMLVINIHSNYYYSYTYQYHM